MKLHGVYDEVDTSTVDDSVIREAIPADAESLQKAPRPNWIARLGKTSLQHFYTHPSQRTTTVNNVTSTFGHLKNFGQKTTVDSIFEAIQKQVVLKRIGYLEPGKPQQFLGRNIDHFGNNLGLEGSYQGDWNDQLQRGDRSRNRLLQTKNRG